MNARWLFLCMYVFMLYGLESRPLKGQDFDIVIRGGRAIDPETGLDDIRNIGIKGSRIAAITKDDIRGRTVLNATGLIVSPGFIDLHQHGQKPEDYVLKAFDGVTTALEMEIGVPDITAYIAERKGKALINYGATADYDASRALAFYSAIPSGELLPHTGPATNDPASPEQIRQILTLLRDQLHAGSLGIGMGIQYVPGASRSEVLQVFQVAAETHLPIYTHIRSSGHLDPGSSVEALGEVIADAAVTGAPLHIVHVNSSCLRDAPECLAMIAGARGRGLDVTTEAYPYTAAMTEVNSALFNPGWQQKLGVSYDALVLPESGEHLTKQRFEQLHADPASHSVLIHMNSDTSVDNDILNPLVMIASDGDKYHPRGAGTYSRVLKRYVREQKSLTLNDAIRKMSLMPAQMLVRSTPEAQRKGRLQVGADADIIVFDLERVSDQATYSQPREPSIGMKYVIVGGVPIIIDGKLQPHVTPGRPLLGDSCISCTRQ